MGFSAQPAAIRRVPGPVAPVESIARFEVTPAALPPGFVRRLGLTAEPPIQFGTLTLNSTPARRVIRLQPAHGEQLFDIAQRPNLKHIRKVDLAQGWCEQ